MHHLHVDDQVVSVLRMIQQEQSKSVVKCVMINEKQQLPRSEGCFHELGTAEGPDE